jgi:signal transduction histidine kinase/HAMP domain-containing protein
MNKIVHYLLKTKLRNKFILAIASIIFFSGIISTTVVYITMSRTLTSELQTRGVVITKNLASNSIEPVLVEDLVSLQHLLLRVKEAEEDVYYAYITDPSGRVLVHTFDGGFPKGLLELNDGSSTVHIQLLETEEGYIRDISVPILNGKAGTVHVGMSENRIRAEIFHTALMLTGITFLLMLSGIFLAYVIGNLITKPIYSLTKGAEEIGKGNLDLKISVKSEDEIKILAETFNRMASELKKSMEEIKSYSLQLEQKVEERTKELLCLQKINAMINAGASQDEIFNAITKGLTSVYGYDISTIYLLNEEGTHLICKGYSASSQIVKQAERLTGITALNYAVPLYEESMLTQVVKTKKPVITDDMIELIKNHTEDSRLKSLAAPLSQIIGIKYGIGLPLISGNKVVGTIGVGSKRKLSDKDVKRLKNFAEQVGLAIGKIKMEQDLREYSEKLKQKVEEKTRQLIQSEKLASLGQLAAGVAHEINNPLTNIMLDAEALRNRDLNEDSAREKIEEIISQAEVAARIIKNLLEFARQSEPQLMEMEPEEIIERALAILSPQLKNIKVIRRYPEAALTLKGDPNQLQQVFVNIILNAIQAMPDGGILGISIVKNGRFIETHISDTGTGIPSENINKIFDPFFTTKEVGEGTGLGLSISLGIVQQHGGEIRVKSQVGVGSTFIVRLPIGDESG